MTEHNSTQKMGVVSSPIPRTRIISLEKVTQATFNFIGSLRGLLGLFVVIGLTLISIRFNWELGELLAVDEESRALLPKGYAALDLAGLFLSGYVAVKSKQPILKGLAWFWFVFLLSLSLFAAASYTVSVDVRLAQAGNERLLASHSTALTDIEQQIATWNTKLADTTRFNRAYQGLNALQAQRNQHLAAPGQASKRPSTGGPGDFLQPAPALRSGTAASRFDHALCLVGGHDHYAAVAGAVDRWPYSGFILACGRQKKSVILTLSSQQRYRCQTLIQSQPETMFSLFRPLPTRQIKP